MQQSISRLFLFLLFLPPAACLLPTNLHANEVRVGVAHEAFALPVHVPLAGYSKRKGRPSLGVHDSVGVRAMALTDGQTSAAIVSADVLIIDEALYTRVRQRLIRDGLPQDFGLLLAATHTHSGPGAYGRRFLEQISMGHFDARVRDAIVDAIAHAVERAMAHPVPCRIAYGSVKTQGLARNRMEPEGLIADQLTVVGLYPATQDTPMAIVANFSAHPTALGAWNRWLSADYPGVLVRELERRFPQATCLFLAGSVGDQAPVKAGIGFERIEWLGATLAQQAAALERTFQPKTADHLRWRQEQLPLPPARIRLGLCVLPRWMGRRLVDDDATLSLLAVGPVVWFGVPCDLASELGVHLQHAATARSRHPVVVGFGCDYIGYCVPERVYETKAYETSMVFNGPHVGDMIVERLVQMLDEVVSHQ